MSLWFIGSRPLPLARLFLGALAGLALLTGPAAGSARAANPSITHFQAVAGPNGAVTFSGTVADDQSLSSCLVMISGPGVTASALILANGTYNTTVTVFGTTPITVTAVAIDADGNLSEPAYATFTPTPMGGGGGGPPGRGTGGGD